MYFYVCILYVCVSFTDYQMCPEGEFIYFSNWFFANSETY